MCDGPRTGSCWNCDHMAEVRMGDGISPWHQFCVAHRDDGSRGDIMEVGPEVTDCDGWEEAYQLVR